MTDTEFANRIKKLSDADLERLASAAYMAAYCESYGNDAEARTEALLEHRLLERERSRRRVHVTTVPNL